jgi:hypothetical protein
MSLICVRASCAAGISRIEWSLAFLSSLSYINLSFPFLFDSIYAFSSSSSLQIPFFPSSLLACLLAFPPPRLVTNHHHQIASRLPNPASTLLLRPTLNHQLRTSAIPSHPTHLKIPPRQTHPHTSLSRPPICSLCHPLQNPTHWTMEPSLHIPEGKSRAPFPVSTFISKTPHIILPPISVEATRRLEC